MAAPCGTARFQSILRLGDCRPEKRGREWIGRQRRIFYPDPEDRRPGTLHDAVAKLARLVEMGLTCIVLMPVNERAANSAGRL